MNNPAEKIDLASNKLLVADESLDFGIIHELRENGVDVISIDETSPGIMDTEVLAISKSYKCILVTEDKDFGELAYRLNLEHFGILLIRLSDMPRKERIQFATTIILNHFDKLKNSFSVLTKLGLRIKSSQNG